MNLFEVSRSSARYLMILVAILCAANHSARADNVERPENNAGSSSSLQEETHSLYQLGHEYYRQGKYDKSLELFKEVISRRSDIDVVLADSMRMVGQINLFALTDFHEAEVAYKQMITLAEQAPTLQGAKPHLLTEALEKLALTYQLSGRHEDSIAARERLLVDGSLSEDLRAEALL